VVTDFTYLYVEDDPLSREALKIVMTRVMGVKHLHIFEDSTDFMARVQALPTIPDLFMLDIHMVPHDGFEMLTMLRADPAYAQACVIALTASVMNEEIAMLKDRGFNGAIGKPIDVAQFGALIQRVMHGETVWHITEA
jgi:CheY-like chemotaxis protein